VFGFNEYHLDSLQHVADGGPRFLLMMMTEIEEEPLMQVLSMTISNALSKISGFFV
jgi:hypothetical protein